MDTNFLISSLALAIFQCIQQLPTKRAEQLRANFLDTCIIPQYKFAPNDMMLASCLAMDIVDMGDREELITHGWSDLQGYAAMQINIWLEVYEADE